MQRSIIASTAISTLLALPSCSLLIDTNPDGVITNAGSAGRGGSGVGGSNNGSGGGGQSGSSNVGGGGLVGNGTAGTGSGLNRGGGAGAGVVEINVGGGGAATAGAGGSGQATGAGGTGAMVGGGAGVGVGEAAASGVGGSPKGGTTGSGGAAVGGLGGASAVVGGNTGTGGKAAGGAASGGIGAGGIVGSGGTTATGGAATGGAPPIVCTGTQTNCSGVCVDVKTSKNNCNACGAACEGYQFCADGKCLPTYQSTRILPAAFTGAADAPTLRTAAVDPNQGDLMLQLTTASAPVTFSAAGVSIAETRSSVDAIARFTSTGSLLWVRDTSQLLYRASDTWRYILGSIGNFALASNGDFAVSHKVSPPSNPGGAVTPYHRLARYRASDAQVKWEAQFDRDAWVMYFTVPRPARNDFLTFGEVHSGIFQTQDMGTVSSYIGTFYGAGATVGADGSTVWMWSGGNGIYAWTNCVLNPWSATTWNITSNPSQPQGVDAYIVGAQDNGTTIGPWFSEGDWGTDFSVVVDAAGDLIVAASSGGITRFNGGQALFDEAGKMLFKVNHTTGSIVWRTPIATYPYAISIAPGGRIVTMDQSSPAYAPTTGFGINLYSGADGSLLSSITTGFTASLIATGNTELYVLGLAPSAADFNPGTAVDTQGATPGVFISRYDF